MTYLFDLDDDDPKPKRPRRKPKPKTAETAISILDLTNQIKSVVEKGFPGVWVRGEITDIARPRSGHLYFTLKDEHAQIRGVMWRSIAERLAFDLDDGQSVLCGGDVEVYAARGSYQLIVRQCRPDGMGNLQMQLAALQKKLAGEGLFDPERKRHLPPLPRRVAIVTSPSGAAIADFLQAAAARHAGIEIILIPASVQGTGSAKSLMEGIVAAHRLAPRPDVLIVSRGGGSMEDLWSFNDESLIRLMSESQIPTVSAVGHEIDVTLSDLVADVRALTPTDAAHQVLPDRSAMIAALRGFETALRRTAEQSLRRRHDQLNALASRPNFTQPHRLASDRVRRLDELDQRGRNAIWNRHRQATSQMKTLAASASALSPLAVLARGYSVTQDQRGRVVRSVADVQEGQMIRTRLPDGTISSEVR
ncbi:MAG: exodeoxyribonuclease VII large subunit [Planctomycetota bacterium]